MSARELSPAEAAEVARFGLDRPEPEFGSLRAAAERYSEAVLDLEGIRLRASAGHNVEALQLVAEVERLRYALRAEQLRNGSVHIPRVEDWLRSVRARVEYLNACSRSVGGLSEQQRLERERAEALVAGYEAVLDLLRGVPY